MSEMLEIVSDVFEKMCKDFVTKETVDLLEEEKWATALWQQLEDNELLKVAVAEQHGGANGDIADLLALYQLTGYYAVPAPVLEHTLANFIIELVGLTPFSSITTILLNEQQTLTLTNGRLDGTIHHVPWARTAQQLVTFAKENDSTKLVAVDLIQAEMTYATNLAAEPRDTVSFEQAEIIAQIEVNELQFQKLIKYATAAKLSSIAGALDKAFQLTVRYSKEREQFGRPIHRFQLVQQHLAILAGEAAIATAAIENMAGSLVDETERFEVAFASIRLDEASKTVATAAHQVHAAIGVTYEHSLQHYTRRLWAWRDEGFTAHYWQEQLAADLLQVEDVWAWMTTQ
ncbi:acyl-CoA dehydrogenase family protein [Metasolibacillus meyeri]|uniref:Acyl-CoA dehydrogenase family protein n=1 Tax=Metasolibacillus meyeri TaxID=1071052 RepID=A0AAW9NM50_9BACL|nr:acyl-CoA dehydrogenase family protein [Metasolibacillus meyeri]MEC1179929.1 acyl-CoA dehydrogenase family protein [Metasolibacillus meyeri]